jgi:hypothetical protein
LPLEQVLEAVSKGARDARLPVRWLQVDEDPVAEITLPEDIESKQAREIDAVRLEEGKIYVSGTTRPRTGDESDPARRADQGEPRRKTQR